MNKRDEFNWFKENINIRSACVYSSQPFNIKYDVSITIPTFNRGELLFATLKSAIEQILCPCNYEIVIVDNDSDPVHVEWMIQKLGKINCNKIKYFVNETNVGLFGNWNMCIRNAQSNIVCMLHDDDILFNDCILHVKKIIEHLKKDQNWAYVKTRNCFFWNENELSKPVQKRRFGLKKYTKLDAILSLGLGTIGSPTCGTLLNKNHIMSIGGYNPEEYPCADVFLPIRLLLHDKKIYITSYPLGGYRMTANISGKPETMIKINYQDRNLIQWIATFNLFADGYAKFFSGARLEYSRRAYEKQLGKDKISKIKELNKPCCGHMRFFLYYVINFIRRGMRIMFQVNL